MHLELALEIFAPDVGDLREPRRQPRRVEQRVHPAERQHGLVKQPAQTRVVPDVGGDAHGAARKRRRHLGRRRVRRGLVQVRDHHVGAFGREPQRGRAADPAGAADHHGDLARNQERRPVAGGLLVQLAPLQRPVLEFEDVRLGEKPEGVDRLRIRDRFEHRPVAQVGRRGPALVAQRGDQAETRDEDDLRPIGDRSRSRGSVPRVIALIFVPLFGDLAAHRFDRLFGRRRPVELEPQRTPAGAENVLRGRHPTGHQPPHPLPRKHRQHGSAVVELQDHTPSGSPEGAAHRRQHLFGETAPYLG